MGIAEKIADIEAEMARTQINKATEHHLGMLKGRLAELRAELIKESERGAAGPGEGFEVAKSGQATVSLIGFPSVGKSTLFNCLSRTENSEVHEREFCTLSCIPGKIVVRGSHCQLLDLPGIVEGAADGRGGGRQVIAAARNSDAIIMLLDAPQADTQRRLLTYELEKMGIRLNTRPKRISITPTKSGQVTVVSRVAQPHIKDEKLIPNLARQLKLRSVQILLHEVVTVQDVIDAITGNCVYVPVLYVVNKIDTVSLAAAQHFATQVDHCAVCVTGRVGLEHLVDALWAKLGLVRVWTMSDRDETTGLGVLEMRECMALQQGKCTVAHLAERIHRSLLEKFKFAIVYGTSVQYQGQQVGRDHVLCDGDVVTIKTN